MFDDIKEGVQKENTENFQGKESETRRGKVTNMNERKF